MARALPRTQARNLLSCSVSDPHPSPPSEPCRGNNETRHKVTLTHAFEIMAYETTEEDFKTVLGYLPGYSWGKKFPVYELSWNQAVHFCENLSAKRGLAGCYNCVGTGKNVSCSVSIKYSGSKIYTCPGYRLPTDAEWEYSYRANTSTAYYNGTNNSSCNSTDTTLSTIGWYRQNHNHQQGVDAHYVGQKAQNAWGLYDMAGNVWEWCHDFYQQDLGTSAVVNPVGQSTGSSHVLRGGSWCDYAQYQRAAVTSQ